jgi:sulfonate transport system permease protein
MRPSKLDRLRDSAVPWLLPAAILLGWQAAVSAGLVSNRFMPAPLDVVRAGWEAGRTGELWTNLGVSTLRALAGFVIGGGIGFALGLANGLSRLSERLTDTTVQMVRNVPHLADPAGDPVVRHRRGGQAVPRGARRVLPDLRQHPARHPLGGSASIEMGRVYGMSRTELFSRVVLPGALPSIFVGLRYALGIMWLTLIVAETISASSGLGYMAMQAREFMLVDVVVLAILIYAALGKLADALTRQLERACLAWNPAYRSA